MKSIELFGLSITAQAEPSIRYAGISIGTNRFRCFFFSYVLGPELGERQERLTYEHYKNITNHSVCVNTNIQLGKKYILGVEFTRIAKGH
jgi:hypothetical protein